MNFILRFFNKKSIRIAELEKAAESHARIVGGHKANYTRICRQYRELDDKYDKSIAEIDLIRTAIVGALDCATLGESENILNAICYRTTEPIDVEETMEQPVIKE